MTAPADVAAPVDEVIEPGEGGFPDEPQWCQVPDPNHPAVRSLLFRDEDAYAPVCDEHDAEIREQLAAAGETIVGEVEIVSAVDEDQPPVTAAGDSPAVEVGNQSDGEMALRFPVLVIEGMDTSDGRYLEPGSLTHRALPLSLLASPESAHGGNDPDAAVLVGRIDTLTRTPGQDVVSKRTGEAFPEGTFVWSATGVMYADVTVGKFNVGDLVRRRFLRGVSVDLAGMDVEMIGDEQLADTENPRRQMVAKSAEIAAATLVCIPAFGDAYVELAGELEPPDPVGLDDLPEGMVASAFPAWRSAEVGDYPALVAAGEEATVVVPSDAAEQLAAVIAANGGEQRDASELAAAIVAHIASNWPGREPEPDAAPDVEASPDLAATSVAFANDQPEAAAEDAPSEEAGMPDVPQPCAGDGDEHAAVKSLIFDGAQQYAATCDEHEQDARTEIEAAGHEVEQVVEIPAEDTTSEDPA